MNWNPFESVGFTSSVVTATVVVGWNTAQIWKQILGSYISMGLDYWNSGVVFTEEELIQYAEDQFDAVFDTVESIGNPVKTLKEVSNTARKYIYGIGTAAGLFSAWHIGGFKEKGRFVTRASGYSLAYIAGLWAIGQLEAISMTLEGADSLIGSVDTSSRASLKTSMVRAIKDLNLPQENVGGKL
jgi:hypothetical protein